MKTVQISLNSIEKVKSFVNDITKFDYDFDLVSGRYVIDAKSIMGIFSLDAQCGNLKSAAYATCRTRPKGALLRLDHNQFFRIQCTLHHFIDAVL